MEIKDFSDVMREYDALLMEANRELALARALNVQMAKEIQELREQADKPASAPPTDSSYMPQQA